MYKDQHKWIQLALMLVDGVITIFSFILSGLLRYRSVLLFSQIVNFRELIIIAVLSSFIAFVLSKMYSEFFNRGYLRELQHVTIYALLVMLFVSLYSFATKNVMALSRLTLLFFFLINLVIAYILHTLIKKASASRARGQHGWKMIVVTDSDSLSTTCRNIQQSEVKDRVVGIILLDKQLVTCDQLGKIPIIDPSVNCMEYIAHEAVDEVLLSISETLFQSEDVQELLANIVTTGILLSLKLNFPIRNVIIEEPYVSRLTKFGDSYILSYANREYDYAMIMLKRVMDIAGSIVGLVLMAVLGPFIAFAILIDSPGPIFFKQKRVGRNGRIFTMLKFRSMFADAEAKKATLLDQNKMSGPLFKVDNDPRITRVGRFIRKTSLDELPQFFNVLNGDMSIVGTRPPTLDEYQQYTSAQKIRLSFRPGITGLWQVSGRNDITSFSDVVKMDIQYIQDWSIYLDFKLILKTIFVAFGGKGAG
jgi:exopolysaccharide biosynthesis polyprenyl glycosylphosphotransferase